MASLTVRQWAVAQTLQYFMHGPQHYRVGADKVTAYADQLADYITTGNQPSNDSTAGEKNG